MRRGPIYIRVDSRGYMSGPEWRDSSKRFAVWSGPTTLRITSLYPNTENDDETEREETVTQLREIALLRLEEIAH